MPPVLAPHTSGPLAAAGIAFSAANAAGPNPAVMAATPVNTVATRNDLLISHHLSSCRFSIALINGV
jgi:hypothetical protein